MINVGIAEYKIVKSPQKLRALGLGSCCGVVLYDELNKIAGMIHILLSDSKNDKNLVKKEKYADTGIKLLVEQMEKNGANRMFIKAKIAGGAHMFNMNNSNSNIFTVGQKNVTACKMILKGMRIPIIAEDVLGSHGRTIIFDPTTSKMLVRTVGKGENTI